MYNDISWPERLVGYSASAFDRGKNERRFHFTFHSDGLATAQSEERLALDLLCELSHLDEIRSLQTASGEFPNIQFDNIDTWGSKAIAVKVKGSTSTTYTSIQSPQNLLSLAQHLIVRTSDPNANPQGANVQAFYHDLIAAQAHHELDQDIFITLSPWLLTHRVDGWLQIYNICTPIEAIKILGLFLRSRDNYTIEVAGNMRRSLDRSGFYWILARRRLPSMWRFHALCVEGGKVRNDDTALLGESILLRCVQALQARDLVGTYRYQIPTESVNDHIRYHFTVLTLVLAGALEAMARIAQRAYGIKANARSVSFRSKDFLKALKNQGAEDLSILATEPSSKAVLDLLYTVRNTIHGAILPQHKHKHGSKPWKYLVVFEPEYKYDGVEIGTTIWGAAKQLGEPEDWGLIKGSVVSLEPHKYGSKLVAAVFKLVDAIATRTDLSGLFPAGDTMPNPSSEPPSDDEWFSKDVMGRVDLLG